MITKTIFITASLLVHDCICSYRPIVHTNVGTIRGLKSDDGTFNMFMGIPYGVVNEKNPLGISNPYPIFEEVFDAIDDSAMCPQIEEYNYTLTGSLDCLHLNIYVPNSASTANRLPVMMYIFGGNFTFGCAGRFIYGPEYLVRHDTILVTINYRVGTYGFLCLNIPEVPGNQGLKDQVLAFKWVHNNIEFFGGDVDRITLFGHSSGAMSVALHLYSPIKPLFNQVILQSGNAYTAKPVQISDPMKIFKIIDSLGFSTNNMNEALAIIAKTDPLTIVQAASIANVYFDPCIEKQFPGIESFLTEFPLKSAIPHIKNMSVMTGIVSNESLTVTTTLSELIDVKLFDKKLRNHFYFDKEKHNEIEEIVRHFYIGDEPVSLKVLREILSFLDDIIIVHPIDRSLDIYFRNGAEKVYYYKFSYEGGRNRAKIKNNLTIDGVTHGDELGYLFDARFLPREKEPSVADQIIIDKITTLWTNFAKYGNPTPESSRLPVHWKPVRNTSARYYLNINTELSLGKRPFSQRMAFWDLFYENNYSYELC